MIDCDKAGQLIEQAEFESIGFWQKRKLRLHLKICKICCDYEEDNKVLSKIIKMAGVKFSHGCISEEEKAKMKSNLNNHQ